MPAKLIDKTTGAPELIDDVDLPAALASGRYLDPGAVAVQREGLPGYTSAAVAQREHVFAPTIDPALAALSEGHAIREKRNEGIAAGAKAFLGGAVGGATAGLLDPFAEEQEFHPVIGGIGTAAGILGPALLGDEAGLTNILPSQAISRAGAAAGERIGGGLLGGVTRGATEGGLFGAGQGTGNLLRSDDPLTLERVASELSSNVLFGAGAGGVLGGAFSLAERGLLRGKTAVDGALERRAARATTPLEGVENGDLSMLDKRALDAIERTENERLFTEQAPRRDELVKELQKYQRANREDDVFRAVVGGADDRTVTSAGGAFTRNDIKLRNMLDDRAGLSTKIGEDPEGVFRLLRVQRQALDEIIPWAQEEQQMWRRAVADAPTTIRADLARISAEPVFAARAQLANDLGLGEFTGPFTEAGLDHATKLAIEEFSKFNYGGAIARGLKMPGSAKILPGLEAAAKWNENARAALEEIAKPQTSPLLAKIADARSVLEAPKQQSLGGALMSAMAPFAGPVAAAASIGSKIIGSLRKVGETVATKTGQATAAITGAAASIASHATPIATRTLLDARFSAQRDENDDKKTLPELYKARTEEIKRLTEYDETGTPRMRFAARQQMAQLFKPIAAVDPVAADRLETIATRRIEHVSSVIPRRPDFGTPQIGPDNWQPSDMQMMSFARTVAATEDPSGVEHRAAAGALTPEDAAAYWAVYPERAQHFKMTALGALQNKNTAIPFDRKLALSMLFGQPMDPSLHPRVIAVLQGQFPAEPGTSGGAQPPRAAPQFGSMSKVSEHARTPAQERAAR